MAYALFLVTYAGLLAMHWRTPLQDPRKLILLPYAAFVVVPSPWIVFWHPTSAFYSTYKEDMNSTFLAFTLFLVTFMAVAYAARMAPVRRPRLHIRPSAMWVALVMLLLSIYAKAYLVAHGMYLLEEKYAQGQQEIPAYISFLNNIHLVGLCFVYAYYDATRSTRRLAGRPTPTLLTSFVAVYFAYTSGTALLQGRRFGVLLPALLVLIVAAAKGRLTRPRLLAAAAALTLGFGALTTLRLTQASTLATGNATPTEVLHSALTALSAEQLASVTDSAVGRIGNPVVIANNIVHYVRHAGPNPEMDSFSLALSGLVPRLLWPHKPALSIGNELGKRLHLISLDNMTTRINPGWVGEGYYNFGHPGVILAAALMALFATLAFRSLDFRFDSGIVLFLQYFIFVFSGFQMEIAFTVNNFVKGMVFSSVLLLAFGKSGHVSSAGPAFREVPRPN